MEQRISITGSVFSLTLGWIGGWTASDAALKLGIISAFLTISYTMYKWGKEIIRDFKKPKATK